MGDHDAGDADVLDDVDEFDLGLLAQLLVERPERLVEQQQLWPFDQAARQGHALLLTAGQLVRFACGIALKLNEAQHGLDAFGDFILGAPVAAQAEGDVVPNREVRKQRIGLEHHVDRPLVGRQAGQVASVEHDLAGGWCFEAGQHAQQSGLATAGGAEQAENLTAHNVQADMIDGPCLAEIFDDLANLQEVGIGFGNGRVHGEGLVTQRLALKLVKVRVMMRRVA